MRRSVSAAIAAAGIVSLAVAVLLTGGPHRKARAQTPPATPSLPVPISTAIAADSGRPAFYSVPASLAGRVIHTTYQLYSYNEGFADPANGRVLTTEVWLRFRADGTPDLLHAITTYADGTLRQEMLQTSSNNTTVLARNLASAPASAPRQCEVRGPTNPGNLQAIAQYFVDEAALSRTGFAGSGSGAPIHTPPATNPSAGSTPIKRYGVDTTVRRLSIAAKPAANVTGTTTFEIGADGRVQGYQYREVDTQGMTRAETWKSFGALEVFDAGFAPSSAFTLSRGGCSA